MSANLQLENQNLKLQVENLEVKMENLKFKHDEALRKVKAENDILKSLVDKNKATNNQIETKNAEINNLERQLLGNNEEIKKLKAEKKIELQKEKEASKAKNTKEENAIEVSKKKVEQLSKEEQRILEGIEKYVVSKRSTTNFSPTYDAWFSWIKDKAPFGTTKIQNYAFVKYKSIKNKNMGKLINFTEYPEFPIMNDNELAIPVVNEGWSAANTKGFLLKEVSSGTSPVRKIKTTFTDEINDLEMGRYYSIKIADTAFSYVTKWYYLYYFTMILFVHQEANENKL